MVLRNAAQTATDHSDVAGWGERELGVFFDDALPRLYGYVLLRVSGDHSVAEELVQEIVLAFAGSYFDRAAQIPDPLAWLFEIARHKLIDHSRRSAVRSQFDAAWSEEIVDTPELSSEFDRIADQDALFALLAPLPESQRIVILTIPFAKPGRIAMRRYIFAGMSVRPTSPSYTELRLHFWRQETYTLLSFDWNSSAARPVRLRTPSLS